MPDQLDMQVRLAIRDIRQKVWEAKNRLHIPQIPIHDYLTRCEETEFQVHGT